MELVGHGAASAQDEQWGGFEGVRGGGATGSKGSSIMITCTIYNTQLFHHRALNLAR